MNRRAPLYASVAVATVLSLLTVAVLVTAEPPPPEQAGSLWRFVLLVGILICTVSGLVFQALLGRLVLYELRAELGIVRQAARETVALIAENKALQVAAVALERRYEAAVTDAEATRIRFLETKLQEREGNGDIPPSAAGVQTEGPADE